MPLDRSALRLIRMSAAFGPASTAGGAEARRQGLAGLAAAADEAGSVNAEPHFFDGPARPVRLHVYRAPLEDRAHAPAPVLVFFHGGGWVAGGVETHDGVCSRLCRASGADVVLVDYRLAPEHPFPAALDDCLAATRWVGEFAEQLGLDPTHIAVGGDSVGAGLAAAVAQKVRDEGGPHISLQVLICPILDPLAAIESLSRAGGETFVSRGSFAADLADYLGGASADDPRVAPLRAASLAGLPPAMIETAECDPFAGEAEAFAEALARAGGAVRLRRHSGMMHYFYALARAIPYAAEAAALIGHDIRRALSSESSARTAA